MCIYACIFACIFGCIYGCIAKCPIIDSLISISPSPSPSLPTCPSPSLPATSIRSLKFGLVHVDFTSPNRTRTPKLSSRYLALLARDNGSCPKTHLADSEHIHCYTPLRTQYADDSTQITPLISKSPVCGGLVAFGRLICTLSRTVLTDTAKLSWETTTRRNEGRKEQ
jgi:hypothetical protein